MEGERPSPGRRNNGTQDPATEAPPLIVSRRPIWQTPETSSPES